MSDKILKAEAFSKDDLQNLDTVTITVNLDDSNYKASTVNIGSVSSGAPPSVTNVGTERDALLNFVLPEGKVGPKGDNGDSATIQIGSVTTGSTPQVVNAGTPKNAILNITLPEGRPGLQGNSGEKGIDGKDGLNGIDGKSTTIKIGSVASGDTPSVTNVGDNTDAILNFVFPKGEKGNQGEKGEQGLQGPQGNAGPQGEQGLPGPKGEGGNNGRDGKDGVDGKDGEPGEPGKDGKDGVDGLPGKDGDKGEKGENSTIEIGNVVEGASAKVVNVGTPSNAILDFTLPVTNKDGSAITPGPKGDIGQPGKDGESAFEIAKRLNKTSATTEEDYLASLIGPQGPKGEDGKDGIPGVQGASGEKGEKGDKGDQGVAGRDGAKGDKGDTGVKGEKGEQGPKGDKGETGDAGIQGPKGDKGPKGDTGIDGQVGPQGLQGEQGIPGVKGEKGDQGIQGERGLPGTSATIAVGKVTTGTPAVSNVGNSTDAIFDFILPAGGGSGGDLSNYYNKAEADSRFALLGALASGGISVFKEVAIGSSAVLAANNTVLPSVEVVAGTTGNNRVFKIKYDKAFTATPIVLVSMSKARANTTTAATVHITDVDKDSFGVRVSSVTNDLIFNYIAVLPKTREEIDKILASNVGNTLTSEQLQSFNVLNTWKPAAEDKIKELETKLSELNTPAKSTVMSDNISITIDNTLVNKIIGCTSINDVTIDLTNMTTGDILSVMNIGFKKNISFTGKTIIGQNNFTGEKGSTASIMIFNEEAYININLADKVLPPV